MSGKPIRVIICDDDEKFLDKMNTMIVQIYQNEGICVDVIEVTSSSDLFEEMLYNDSADALLMDIELNNENGLDVVSKIREKNRMIDIVFVSSHDKYFQKAFQLRPVDFLIKPVDFNECKRVLDVIYHERCMENRYYDITFSRDLYRIPYSEIMYVESNKHDVIFTCVSGKTYRTKKRLDLIEKDFKKSDVKFLRIHKSYLVSIRHIVAFTPEYVLMSDDRRMNIAEKRLPDVRMAYMNFIFGRDTDDTDNN